MAKILVVDDSATMRAQLKSDLNHGGHDVLVAKDGEAGLSAFHADGPFDLVLADVNMPIRDGLSMVSEIRGSAAGRTVPVFMLTSEGGASAKALGRSIGATAWIVKPYAREMLLAAVQQVAATRELARRT